jgi:hypothetical protein
MNKYIIIIVATISVNTALAGFMDPVTEWFSQITEPVKPPILKPVVHPTTSDTKSKETVLKLTAQTPNLGANQNKEQPSPTNTQLVFAPPEKPLIHISPTMTSPDDTFNDYNSRASNLSYPKNKQQNVPVEFTNSYTIKEPTINGDHYEMDEDESISISPMKNDYLPKDLGFRVISISESKNATIILDGDNIQITPLPNFNGALTFKYIISDKKNNTLSSNIKIDVNSINDLPIAKNDMFLTQEDTPVLLPSFIINDFDIDEDNLKVISNSRPLHGSLKIDSGMYLYTPNKNYNGIDKFTYTISDTFGATSKALISVMVKPVNDTPNAEDDKYTTLEDKKLFIQTFLDNDADVDDDLFYIKSFTKPSYGTLAYTGSKFIYMPEKNFHGVDYFYYTIEDTKNTVNTAKISITIKAINDQPTANPDDPFTIPTNQILIIDNIHINDTDLDGDEIKIADYTRPLNGELSFDQDHTFTYIPNPDFTGIDRFTYTVTDGRLTSNISSVEIIVGESELNNDSDSTSLEYNNDGKDQLDEEIDKISSKDILKEIQLINEY